MEVLVETQVSENLTKLQNGELFKFKFDGDMVSHYFTPNTDGITKNIGSIIKVIGHTFIENKVSTTNFEIVVSSSNKTGIKGFTTLVGQEIKVSVAWDEFIWLGKNKKDLVF